MDDRGHKVSVCHEENGAAVAAALKCLLIYVSVIKLKYESLKFHSSGMAGGRRAGGGGGRRLRRERRRRRRRGKIYAAQTIFQKAANNHCSGRSSSLARSPASAILMSERTSEARIINMNFFIATGRGRERRRRRWQQRWRHVCGVVENRENHGPGTGRNQCND